jgi:GDPmannose 4,6-dehydratase|tara:strand:- start:5437 stop:6444 length:1008 start_codon:yes stop_codon:yes gene_type:complete
MKKALITGINGQTGSYMAEYLLDKGYEVWGTVKRNSVVENQTARLPDEVLNKCTTSDGQSTLEYADLLDMPSLIRVIQRSQPDEIYHFAAQSHVRISFDQPSYTTQTIVLGTLNLLEAVRLIKPDTKIVHAASSECFGNSIDDDGFQRETTAMLPVSPYGCSKVYAYNICRNYRRAYNMFISNSISFNHESARRGSNFVTAKICKIATQIKLGRKNEIKLGNLSAKRDWNHAKDICNAMYMMLQHDRPDDFVVASGETKSVEELCEFVFNKLGLNFKDYLKIDKRYYRAEELHELKGDATKIKETLGWEPDFAFEDIIDDLLDHWHNELTGNNDA